MEPRLLLQWLLDRDGDNSNSLAARLKNATTQPQIHKYLSGKARQPRHSTLEPIAKHYGIPVEALYSEDEADRVMAGLLQSGGIPPDFNENQPLARMQKAPPAINGVALSADAMKLAMWFDSMPHGVHRDKAYADCFGAIGKRFDELDRIAALDQSARPETSSAESHDQPAACKTAATAHADLRAR